MKKELSDKDKQAQQILRMMDKNNLSKSELENIIKSSKKKESNTSHSIDVGSKKFSYAYFSDSHIGCNSFKPEVFDKMIRLINMYKPDFVLNAGDNLEGMSNRPGHVYELTHIGFNQQFNYAVDLFSQINVPIYGIDGNHDCLSIDTEVLTKRGWLFYDEVTSSDEVWSLNDDGVGEWSKINDVIIKEPDDEYMFEVETNNVSIKCTPKHRVFHKKRISNKWKYSRMKDLGNRVILRSSSGNNFKGVDVSDDMIRLVAWVLTDGHIKKDRGYKYFDIYQSKNHDYIESVLDSLGFKYTVIETKPRCKSILGVKIKSALPSRKYHILAEHNKEVLKYIESKDVLPKWLYELNDAQFNVFLKEVVRGDGSKYLRTKKECYVLYGKKSFLDEMQALCNIHGYRAFISLVRDRDYRLNICKVDTASFDVKKSLFKTFNEKIVWCLSVPYTNFFIRRNGKSHFTGNSWYEIKSDQGIIVGNELDKAIGNYKHLGEMEGDLKVDGVDIKLFHANDGTAYAVSYKMQKLVESFSGGEKPAILHSGHYHKSLYMFNRNVHGVESGTLCGQSKFMRGKKIPAHTGFGFVRVWHDGKGSVKRFNHEFVPFYE